jgi:hypothetical protein
MMSVDLIKETFVKNMIIILFSSSQPTVFFPIILLVPIYDMKDCTPDVVLGLHCCEDFQFTSILDAFSLVYLEFKKKKKKGKILYF